MLPGHARLWRYPPLLYRLDANEARNTFLGLAAEEKNAAVGWAMMRSLQPDDASWLLKQLDANSAATRLAGCTLSLTAALADEEANGSIIRLLQDPAHRVRDAAEKTLEQRRRERWTRTLVDQVDQPMVVASRAWAILDAVLAVAEVGYRGTAWPQWVHQFVESRPVRECPALRLVLLERLETRRKKALEEAERRAKNAR